MRNNTVNEKWSIVKFADAYNIRSAINGLCVAVAGGQCRPNDLIELQNFQGRRHDVWDVVNINRFSNRSHIIVRNK